MTNAMHTNGRPQRKTLAAQLDRLDTIIDALSGGLHGAVLDEVRAAITVAVSEAVSTVLREVLSRPELLRPLLAQAVPPAPVPAQPTEAGSPSKLKQLCTLVKTKAASGWHWLRNKVVSACQWLGRKVYALPAKIRTKLAGTHATLTGKVRGFFRSLRETGRKAWDLRRPVSLSLGIGLVAGTIGYLAGPVISALALGACGSTISLTAYLIAPFVSLWRSLKAQSA